MTPVEILEKIKTKFPGVASTEAFGILNMETEQNKLRSLLVFLRDELNFDFMNFMTGVDRPTENIIEVVYQLFSFTTKASIVIRVKLDRTKPEIETVSDIYRTAEWHEREAAEMFGIVFLNHPDPRILLLPENFKGQPLKKDFRHPNMTPLPEVK